MMHKMKRSSGEMTLVVHQVNRQLGTQQIAEVTAARGVLTGLQGQTILVCDFARANHRIVPQLSAILGDSQATIRSEISEVWTYEKNQAFWAGYH